MEELEAAGSPKFGTVASDIVDQGGFLLRDVKCKMGY